MRKLCSSHHGKSRCTKELGHDGAHADIWDGEAQWSDAEAGASFSAKDKLVVQVDGLDLISQFFTAAGDVISFVSKLGAKHIYLDPHDAAPDWSVRSYCSLCMCYGIGLEIDHAESCLVGRAMRAVVTLQAQIAAASTSPNSTERISANSSTAPVEQGGAAAEGPLRASQHPAGLRVEYLAENPRNKFNPYQHPCQAITGGLVCELEHGHAGAHCSDGSVWADDGRRFA